MKFEYRTIRITIDMVDTLKRFSDIGLVGWELVSADNGIAYFKRELKPKSEAELLA